MDSPRTIPRFDRIRQDKERRRAEREAYEAGKRDWKRPPLRQAAPQVAESPSPESVSVTDESQPENPAPRLVRVDENGKPIPDFAERREAEPEAPLFTQHEQWRAGKLLKVDIIYSEEIHRLAYEIWLLKATRNIARTARMLEKELEGELPAYPTASAIRNWKNAEQWEARASDDLKNIARHLDARHFEKLFAMTDELLEVATAIATNDHPEKDPKRLDIISRTVQELLKLRGIGTAGVHARPTLPAPSALALEAGSSPADRSRAIREEILEAKQASRQKKTTR